jgi:dihydroorotate dehydrogenase subfamily 2
MLALNPDLYSWVLRPLLFGLPPETAQGMAHLALKQSSIWRALSPALRFRSDKLRLDLCGLGLQNPIGLAAGYDKDCELLPSLAALGFGYLTPGTVTEFARPGNARPRVLRVAGASSLINALGFPGRGLDFATRQLEKAQGSLSGTAVVVSVSGTTVDEIVRCHARLEPLADAIEVNISSPNTAGLRVFQQPAALGDLLGRIGESRKKPLFVKLPPYGPADELLSLETEGRDRVLGLANVCVEQGVDAVTVANTWPIRDSRLAVGEGGLSGKQIFPGMVRMVADIKSEVGNRLVINACGGIFSGEDAWQALRAGATTVQLLTGMIYSGPGIVKRINRELLKLMEAHVPEPPAA